MHIETQPRRKHSISLTPLIDVVFILLLFFMLATNFTDWRQITLATGTTATAESGVHAPAVIRVMADGTLRYDGHGYDSDTLVPILMKKHRSGDLQAIVIHPAAKTTLGPTVSALDELAATGLPVALGHSTGKAETP